MEIRGERECLECGSRWSYFETRSVECPECGSLRSKSLSSEELDTESDEVLDTSEAVSKLDDLGAALEEAEEECRSYVSGRGFVRGGELQPPDTRYVMATEVKYLAEALLRRTREVTDDERRYVVDLIRGLQRGEPPEGRPESLDAYHRLAVADTVEEYAREFTRYARNNSAEVPDSVEEARDKARRTKATEGDEDDAVDGLRLLRDAYEEIQESDVSFA